LRWKIGPPAITLGAGDAANKVMSLSDALAKLDPDNLNCGKLTGYFTRDADLNGAGNARQLFDRLRLDGPHHSFSDVGPYAVLETPVSTGIRDSSKIPRKGGYSTGNSNEFVPQSGQDVYPFTGNGFAASKDGHLTPEWSTAPVAMEPGTTVISFKNMDGTPRTVTIGGNEGSRWVLRANPGSASGYVWEAVP
jgi:hypothetical protein